MNALEKVCEEILEWLRHHQRIVVDLLQPGLPIAQLRDRYGFLPQPSDIAWLYSWRNGTRLSQDYMLDDHYFFPGYYFMALEEALDVQRIYAVDPEWEGWFPVFASGGGDYYVVDLSSQQVIWFIHESPGTPAMYADLTTMLRTVNECYQQGAYSIGADGFMQTNDELAEQIRRKNNPGLNDPYQQPGR